MNSIQIVACIGMIAGFFFLFGLSPAEFTGAVFTRLTGGPKSIRSAINETTKRKKQSYLRREVTEVRNILKMTGREARFGGVCAASLALFALGAAIAATLGNFFLAPVLAVGFMFLPFWYIRLTQNHYKNIVAAELETALSIITTAYLRNEDIHTAIEENLEYLNPPVKNVFKDFLTRIRLIDPDLEAGLREMREKIANEVFKEWCDALCACLQDRSLKSTLTPIVAKLSDMRVVNGELENLVSEPRKEYIIMQILVIGNIPLIYMLNKSWFETLMYTTVGQIILAVCGVVIFVSTAFVVKLTQPIEYKR